MARRVVSRFFCAVEFGGFGQGGIDQIPLETLL